MRKKQRDKAHDSFSNGNLEQKKNDGDFSRVSLLGFLVSGKKKRFDASLPPPPPVLARFFDFLSLSQLFPDFSVPSFSVSFSGKLQ